MRYKINIFNRKILRYQFHFFLKIDLNQVWEKYYILKQIFSKAPAMRKSRAIRGSNNKETSHQCNILPSRQNTDSNYAEIKKSYQEPLH